MTGIFIFHKKIAKKKEVDSPVLKIASVHQYNNSMIT